MQLQYRRKRVWIAALIATGFLGLVIVDILEQGAFPKHYPITLRALGFIVPLIALFLLIEILRDTARQAWVAMVGLAANVTVNGIAIFQVPIRPGDTIITVLVALALISLPAILGWVVIIWALKSSSGDFNESKDEITQE